MKNVPWNTIVVCASILIGIYFFKQPTVVPVVPTPAPVVNDDLAEMRQVLGAVSPGLRRPLGALYCAMGDNLDRVDSISSPALRGWLKDADTLMIKGTDVEGSVPGFGAAKDRLFEKALGLESRELSKAEIQKVADLCHEISKIAGYMH